MWRIPGRSRALAVALAVVLTATAASGIRKFQVRQPGTRNFGVWRLTHDPAVRAHGNYHNQQCFSPNGRYTCYTRFGPTGGRAGGKGDAEVHVMDLMTGRDRLVSKGFSVRWAHHHNWLFFTRYTGDGKPPYETGSEQLWYDADTGKTRRVCRGMEILCGTDCSDSWLFGVQRYRGDKRPFRLARVRLGSSGKLERIELKTRPDNFYILNPRHPVISMRGGRGDKNRYLRARRRFFDLDGKNERPAMLWAEIGHATWLGNGAYLLFGNQQLAGRRWNESYPSDLVLLAREDLGDACPCDHDGRYVCGAGLKIFDLRSGDFWYVVHPHSSRVYPMAGDNSTLSDIDSKGSPDATKIHYHSTRDLEGLATARVTRLDAERGVLRVESTEGFPPSGDIVCDCEVVGYDRKTPTTFEGLERRRLGTRKGGLHRKGRLLLPLSAFLLSAEERKRALPDAKMLKAKVPATNPLLYQRQTDCYIVVVRKPHRPVLRLRAGGLELIPGELHYETRGYRLFRDGRPVSGDLAKPGARVRLPGGGTYAAAAVEWSGLESAPGQGVRVKGPATLTVLKDKPADFAWTRRVWKVGGRPAPKAEALRAPQAEATVEHVYDGVIARETWRKGKLTHHEDLNAQGKPIRLLDYRAGKLASRVYKAPDGHVHSREFFGPDGYKTEYVRYYGSPGRRGKVYCHWRYQKGRIMQWVKRGRVLYNALGTPPKPPTRSPVLHTPAQPGKYKDVGDGAALFMKLDGDLKDSSQGCNGARSHGVVFVEDKARGKAARFDGKGYVQVLGTQALDLGVRDFTVEYDFKLEPKAGGTPNTPHIGTGYHGFRAGSRTSVWDTTLRRQAYADWKPKPYADGKWHHYAAVFDRAKGLAVYIDGKRVTGTPNILDLKGPPAKGTLMLGAWPGAKKQDTFKGLMRDVRVTRRALTPKEFGGANAAPWPNAQSVVAPGRDLRKGEATSASGRTGSPRARRTDASQAGLTPTPCPVYERRGSSPFGRGASVGSSVAGV